MWYITVIGKLLVSRTTSLMILVDSWHYLCYALLVKTEWRLWWCGLWLLIVLSRWQCLKLKPTLGQWIISKLCRNISKCLSAVKSIILVTGFPLLVVLQKKTFFRLTSSRSIDFLCVWYALAMSMVDVLIPWRHK